MSAVKVFEIHLNLDDCQYLYDYIRQEHLERPQSGWDLPSLISRSKRSPDDVQRSKELIVAHKRLAKAYVDKGVLENEKSNKKDDDQTHPIFTDVFGLDNSTVLPPWVLPIYKEGDKIKGEVILDFKEAVQAENIKILFHGRANTNIEEEIEEEVYVKNKIILWQKTGSKEDQDLAISPHVQTGECIHAGRRKVPFEFDIPHNVQNSIPELIPENHDYYAHISYYLKATINKGNLGRRGNVVVHQPIWVESQKDYDSTSIDLSPISVSETKKVGLVNSHNIIHCQVSLPQKCFVKGDKIPVTVNVENKSDCEIYDVITRLEVRFHYGAVWSNFKTSQKYTLKGTQVSAGAVSSGMSPLFKLDVPFEFPLSERVLMPAGPIKCKVIQLQYRINVEVKLKGLHTNLNVYVPIEIRKRSIGPVSPDLSSSTV